MQKPDANQPQQRADLRSENIPPGERLASAPGKPWVVGALRGGGGSKKSAAVFFLRPEWRQEQRRRLLALSPSRRSQVRRLMRIFTWAEKNQAKGWTLEESFAGPMRRWRGQYYPDGRTVLPAWVTILRLYRLWKDGGRIPLAILPRWHSPIKIKRDDLAAFVAAAKMPSVTSFRQARRRIAVPRAGEAAFRKALPSGDYEKINRLFALRRRIAWLRQREDRLARSLNMWPVRKPPQKKI